MQRSRYRKQCSTIIRKMFTFMRTIFQIKKQIIGLYDLCYLFVKIKEYVLLVVNEYPKIYHKTSQEYFLNTQR
jgi:hypothetical protein